MAVRFCRVAGSRSDDKIRNWKNPWLLGFDLSVVIFEMRDSTTGYLKLQKPTDEREGHSYVVLGACT